MYLWFSCPSSESPTGNSSSSCLGMGGGQVQAQWDDRRKVVVTTPPPKKKKWMDYSRATGCGCLTSRRVKLLLEDVKMRVPWQTCPLGDVERIEVMGNLATTSIRLIGETGETSQTELARKPISHDSWFFVVNWYGNGHSHLQEIFHESTVKKEGSKMAEVPWIPAGYPIDETSINRFVYSTCPKSPAPLRENKKTAEQFRNVSVFFPMQPMGVQLSTLETVFQLFKLCENVQTIILGIQGLVFRGVFNIHVNIPYMNSL